MVVGRAGRAHAGQPAQAGVPADEIGAKALQLQGGGDEVGGKPPRVDELEVLPDRVRADDHWRAHLADEVRSVDGDGAAYAARVDDDLDRLPAEQDLAAAL